MYSAAHLSGQGEGEDKWHRSAFHLRANLYSYNMWFIRTRCLNSTIPHLPHHLFKGKTGTGCILISIRQVPMLWNWKQCGRNPNYGIKIANDVVIWKKKTCISLFILCWTLWSWDREKHQLDSRLHNTPEHMLDDKLWQCVRISFNNSNLWKPHPHPTSFLVRISS